MNGVRFHKLKPIIHFRFFFGSTLRFPFGFPGFLGFHLVKLCFFRQLLFICLNILNFRYAGPNPTHGDLCFCMNSGEKYYHY